MKLKSKWKYIAQDEDGSVCLFTHKPKKDNYLWRENDSKLINQDSAEISLSDMNDCFDIPDLGSDWEESLHEILDDGSFKKVTDVKLNEAYYEEAAEHCQTISSVINTLLKNHPVIERIPRGEEQLEDCIECIKDLYNSICKHRGEIDV